MNIKPFMMIYPPNTTDFSKNGTAILTPNLAEVELKENQAHSLHLEHPVDDAGNWKSLQMQHIIKVPIKYRDEMTWQPLRIYKMTKQRSGNSAKIVVDARHIFYDCNNVLLQDAVLENRNCLDAMRILFSAIYRPTGYAQASDRFVYTSDITDLHSVSYKAKTLTACLIGENNSIVNTYGGELYVNNNYISINRRKENARDLAFNLKYGLNLVGITATYDSEKAYNALLAVSNKFGSKSKSIPYTDLGFAYDKTAYISYNHDDDDTEASYNSEFNRYFSDISNIKASYTVNYADLPATREYQGFLNLSNFEVGDTGIIDDTELGIRTAQKIVAKKIDVIRQITKSITVGSFIPSIADLNKYKR